MKNFFNLKKANAFVKALINKESRSRMLENLIQRKAIPRTTEKVRNLKKGYGEINSKITELEKQHEETTLKIAELEKEIQSLKQRVNLYFIVCITLIFIVIGCTLLFIQFN